MSVANWTEADTARARQKGTASFDSGLDLHAKTMYLCVLDQAGTIRLHKNVPANAEAFLRAIVPFRLDLVVAEEPQGSAPRKLGQGHFRSIQKIGRKLEKLNANYEFIGMAFFSERGFGWLRQAWQEAAGKFKDRAFYESESVKKADFNDLLQFLIDQGRPVHGLEIEHGWSEIHSLEDHERVSSFFATNNEVGATGRSPLQG